MCLFTLALETSSWTLSELFYLSEENAHLPFPAVVSCLNTGQFVDVRREPSVCRTQSLTSEVVRFPCRLAGAGLLLYLVQVGLFSHVGRCRASIIPVFQLQWSDEESFWLVGILMGGCFVPSLAPSAFLPLCSSASLLGQQIRLSNQ